MNRTQWPLLNRARLNGVSFLPGFKKPILLDLQAENIIPMNIQYAFDTCPLVLNNSVDEILTILEAHELRAPFPAMWVEWVTTAYGTKGDYADWKQSAIKTNANVSLVSDSCALILPSSKDPSVFSMHVGWDTVSQRVSGRSYPVPMYGIYEASYEELCAGSLLNNEDGFPITPTWLGQALCEEHNAPNQAIAEESLDCIIPVLWSWVLLSCNNVTTVESQPNMRNNKRQKDPSRVVHRELRVQVPPGGKRSHSVSEGDEKAGTAFHVRIGHFADYTKGKGLFGKYHGKYWIPSTTVGDVEYGTVLKSYRLEG